MGSGAGAAEWAVKPSFLAPVEEPAAAEELLDAARSLAREIAGARLRAKDGTLTWLRPNRSTELGAAPLVAAGPHLYEGAPGIAVYFAALSRVDANAEYRELALEAVVPLRRLLDRLLNEPTRAQAMRLACGGLVGLGSYVYALLTVGRLCDAPELLADALRVTCLITPEQVAVDPVLDVVSGAAGCILSLLTLARHVPGANERGQTPQELAALCAEHLLRRRIDRDDGSTAWLTNPQYPVLTGFAHGSTGIACALLKLYAVGGGAALLTTALRAWEFERSTFSAEHENWIDQTSPHLRFLNQWCFGAPGIALGRLATLAIVHDDRVEKEIRIGLRHTATLDLSAMDHICCGDMGRVDVLLAAASRLGLPELRTTANKIARRVLERASRRGRFVGLVKGGARDPSLFSGEAGIGYTLLRLARPDQLPCLLTLE
jgi:type 2 lantibiotic biosynthesis protein LanM